MQIREYRLPAADARPRRLALASDGTIYYTDYARGYVGHFDPSEGKLIKEWPSPGGPNSRPYGIAISGDGEDPKTESFSTEPIPSGGGVVRNMVATSSGELYLACSGVNKVAVVHLKP